MAQVQATNPLLELQRLGQSPWHDNIHRGLLRSGDLARLVRDGDVTGLTSNPTIFAEAIARGGEYDEALGALTAAGRTPEAIVETLIVDDVRAAADVFLPVFQRTRGADGYVSVEVAPTLAHDTAATMREARRLWRAVNRPNVMVKIPATVEGLPAIEECIFAGVNVNVTLIFSLARYDQVIDAFLRGLTRRLEAGMRVDRIASVASFFVSRVDTAVDRLLEDRIGAAAGERRAQLERLRGKTGIAQAKLAYVRYRERFADGFAGLTREGARPQRPLWASTSSKNPALPDVYYVEALIGPDTVNTMPPATLGAYKDHGHPDDRLGQAVDRARSVLAQLRQFGIDMDAVTARLESEGVAAFATSWQTLLDTVARRRDALRLAARTRARLGPAERAVARALAELAGERVGGRLWSEDPTLWKREQGAPGTGSNAWLTVPDAHGPAATAIGSLLADVRAAGLTRAVVCALGADALPADLLRRALGRGRGGLELHVLDAADPVAVLAAAERGDPARTLFVLCATGHAAVVERAFGMLWGRARAILGDAAGAHFVAIGTPGGPLESLAGQHGFRRMFRTPADLGGRWAALSALGLVPAALLGADVGKLLERTRRMLTACDPVVPPHHNPGLWLGAALGALARSGRDKLTLLLPDRLVPFGAWIEQLVAGATGKDGHGLVPIVGEPAGTPALYGKDRLFVHVRLGATQDRVASSLAAAGHPVLTLGLTDGYDLGGEIVRWEMAVAAASHLLEVHPFAEPESLELEAAARRALVAGLPHPADALVPTASDFAARLGTQLAAARGRRWVAITAWCARTPRRERLLADLRIAIRKRFGVATTVAFGAAAVYATGQLHVGGPPTAILLDLTADEGVSGDVADARAASAAARASLLMARRRPLLRVHLGRSIDAGLAAVLAALQRRPARPGRSSRTAVRRKSAASARR